MVRLWRARRRSPTRRRSTDWWKQIDKWRARKSLAYKNSNTIIKPQYAIQRLYELTKDRDTYITTEVGQHQMWAAQFYHFQEPNRWMTSGGLGTMGYGLPAAIGVQLAHPKSLVIDIAGEASVLMNMQEMSTAVQYRLPIKIFIINNQYMGMVRQWQELLHGGRYAESYTHSLPDFVKLAEAYHAVGIRCEQAGRPRRRDPGDDRRRPAGDLRLRGRPERELLPDDPVRPRPQRDDPGRHRRERRGCDHRRRQGDGAEQQLSFNPHIALQIDFATAAIAVIALVVSLWTLRHQKRLIAAASLGSVAYCFWGMRFHITKTVFPFITG